VQAEEGQVMDDEEMTMDLRVQDVYDVAFLSGGCGRVVDVALVDLLESGRVRVQRSGQLTVVADAPATPVERAVLDVLLPRRAAAWRQVRRTAIQRACAEVEARVAGAGLVQQTSASRLLGALDPRRPLGQWARTRAGRAAAAAPPPTDPPGRSSYAVAVGGLAAMADPALRDAVLGLAVLDGHRRPWARSDGSGTGWSWGGDGGSGSGCGGSSGCGGGGGCGGGS
jgi:hypothetical protein